MLDKDIPKIKKDKDGNYLLKDGDFIAKANLDGGKNSPLWICTIAPNKISENEDGIRQSPMCNIVVKNLFDENERETALIAEEIARQLGLPVAQYYPAIYMGKEYSKEEVKKKNSILTQSQSTLTKDVNSQSFVTHRVVLTPSFLKEGEELITGDRIAGYDMDVSTVPDKIRDFFEKRGVEKEKIEKLITDYRVVMAYNCLINHRDCHNGNWGYIKDKNGKYKISHIFDLEGSLDENELDIRAIYVGDIYSGTGENIDAALLKELLKDEACRDRVRSFLRLNIEMVFNNVFLSKGIVIPKKKKDAVRKIIMQEKDIIRESIMKIDRDCMER